MYFEGDHIVPDEYTRVGTLIVATLYIQLIQNRYMFRSFTVLQCSHQHCVQPVASDVEVVGYLQQRLLCREFEWSGLPPEESLEQF